MNFHPPSPIPSFFRGRKPAQWRPLYVGSSRVFEALGVELDAPHIVTFDVEDAVLFGPAFIQRIILARQGEGDFLVPLDSWSAPLCAHLNTLQRTPGLCSVAYAHMRGTPHLSNAEVNALPSTGGRWWRAPYADTGTPAVWDAEHLILPTLALARKVWHAQVGEQTRYMLRLGVFNAQGDVATLLSGPMTWPRTLFVIQTGAAPQLLGAFLEPCCGGEVSVADPTEEMVAHALYRSRHSPGYVVVELDEAGSEVDSAPFLDVRQFQLLGALAADIAPAILAAEPLKESP